ncbi:MAG TPA: hypothetical protein VLF67_01835 [Candidatus Saccharimonas sp.]|nr:hypothetical protein [Candidatus Saccharimonas sp.]
MAPATAPLVRTNQTDPQWHEQVRTLATAALKKHQGILIEYLFEPPATTVPQRLYRYDVFDDYLSRHRDDFEFGYDLITRAEIISARRTFGVYVIEIGGNANHLYVGQSWYSPEERLRQHLTGYAAFHAAKPFKHKNVTGKLRPDIYTQLPRYRTQAEAEKAEAWTALQLRKAGFRVEGGH